MVISAETVRPFCIKPLIVVRDMTHKRITLPSSSWFPSIDFVKKSDGTSIDHPSLNQVS